MSFLIPVPQRAVSSFVFFLSPFARVCAVASSSHSLAASSPPFSHRDDPQHQTPTREADGRVEKSEIGLVPYAFLPFPLPPFPSTCSFCPLCYCGGRR